VSVVGPGAGGWPVVLFDLDGTITDPKLGITSGVQRALASLDIRVEDRDELVTFIGPPLQDAFAAYPGVGADRVDGVVATFREYYLDQGMFECTVHDGIAELLAVLAADGRRLAVATSKVDWMAERILEHFGLRDAFEFVGGALLDGSRRTKVDVVEHTLTALALAPDGGEPVSRVVLVGDREHDVLAAHHVGIASIGVRWGYAEPGELAAAKPFAIAGTVAELAAILSAPDART
jgi:phosphoglycolate phosphatase